jgi:hypothetical protein
MWENKMNPVHTAFLAHDNLSATYRIIADNIKKTTNGVDISSMAKYTSSFPRMAKIIVEKCTKEPPTTPPASVGELNTRLIKQALPMFLKYLAKDGHYATTAAPANSPSNPRHNNQYMPPIQVPATPNVYNTPIIPHAPPNGDSAGTASGVSDAIYNNLQELEYRDKQDPMAYLSQFSTQREKDMLALISAGDPAVAQSATKLSQMDIGQKGNPYDMQNIIYGIHELVPPDTPPRQSASLMPTTVQPAYQEREHYLTVNSADRAWDIMPENRYRFQVKFDRKYDATGSRPSGTSVERMFRNIISVELVMAIMPLETYIEAFDTRLYFNISKYPYLSLKIAELNNVFSGTNSDNNQAFSLLTYDKTFFTEVLSASYTTPGIVQSTPPVNFATEFRRGYIKYQPTYFEKKKYYSTPLASLPTMSIHITDHRGYDFNAQSDVLQITAIAFTNALNTLTSADYEIDPKYGYPFVDYTDTTRMIKITTASHFSNRLFRIGDRVIIRGHVRDVDDTAGFAAFINRVEGHIIINLDVEDGAADGNKSFLSHMYIAPPGTMNATNNGINGYYDSVSAAIGAATSGGALINNELQCNLMFRIITRDYDTSSVIAPANI